MPRYFLHLYGPEETAIDPEGTECPDKEAVHAKAVTAARDLMGADVRNGRLHLTSLIEVHDDAGEIIDTVRFREAIEIIGA